MWRRATTGLIAAGAGWLLLLAGCRSRRLAEHADTTGPLPPDTIMLSSMMAQLSGQPGFTDKFLQVVEGDSGHNQGAALLTPDLVHHLRDVILGRKWQGLDRFPGWTMREINPTVRVVGHYAGKDAKVDDLATQGGAPAGNNDSEAARLAVTRYIDLGEDTLDRGGGNGSPVSLDRPSEGKGFITADYVSNVGDGVTRGDGPNPELAQLHAESARLAHVLNRLSLNTVGGAAPFAVEVGGRTSSTPQDLVRNLGLAGRRITVADSRYFANFGHLHFRSPAGQAPAAQAGQNNTGQDQDVMMPFWVNSQILVPHTDRPLLVPVSHAEYEWFIEGPDGKLTAAVCFYFGIDGKAEWRTMDQLDQRWVMNRHAHEYRGADAVEVTRLSGLMVVAYAHQHQRRPNLPFGGYYALGVCQDVVAAIELKMTGTTTLFPNTADARLFDDGRDAEINRLMHRIPKDRSGRPPEVARVLGSLPVGDSDEELSRVTIPGLGPDLVAVHDAWTEGTLRRVRPRWEWALYYGTAVLGLVAGLGFIFWVRRRETE